MKIYRYINQDKISKYAHAVKDIFFVSFIMLMVWGLMIAYYC